MLFYEYFILVGTANLIRKRRIGSSTAHGAMMDFDESIACDRHTTQFVTSE